jgi:cytochrome-b5 reductase
MNATRFARIGGVVCASALAQSLAVLSADGSSGSRGLSQAEFRPFKVSKIETLTHDTKKYTVDMPADHRLVVATVMMIEVPTEGGKRVARPYTPTSSVRARTHMEFIIKAYPAGVVSKAMDGLREGEEISLKGPFVKYAYQPNKWESIGLLAGGTGITPMYQLIEEVLADPRDRSQMTLVYASRTPADIILKKELDALAAVHRDRLRVVYTVDAVPAGQQWAGRVGYMDAALLKATLPAPTASNSTVMVCGPPPLMALLSGPKKSPSDQGELTGLLQAAGYKPAQVFKY